MVVARLEVSERLEEGAGDVRIVWLGVKESGPATPEDRVVVAGFVISEG